MRLALALLLATCAAPTKAVEIVPPVIDRPVVVQPVIDQPVVAQPSTNSTTCSASVAVTHAAKARVHGLEKLVARGLAPRLELERARAELRAAVAIARAPTISADDIRRIRHRILKPNRIASAPGAAQ